MHSYYFFFFLLICAFLKEADCLTTFHIDCMPLHIHKLLQLQENDYCSLEVNKNVLLYSELPQNMFHIIESEKKNREKMYFPQGKKKK